MSSAEEPFIRDSTLKPPSRLEGTSFLPSLSGIGWEPSEVEGEQGIGPALQVQLKRARVRVEILREESDPSIKFELFQRLNTGGVNLSQQEVRNSVGLMIDATFQTWLLARAESASFDSTTDQTEAAKERQSHVELALRYFAFRSVNYRPGLDVHEYLDSALIELAGNQAFDRRTEEDVFNRTFGLLDSALGGMAFKRWDGQAFTGKFLMSVFEVVATGVSANIAAIEAMDEQSQLAFVERKCRELWVNPSFLQHSGAGVRGTTRLMNLLPMAQNYFRP